MRRREPMSESKSITLKEESSFTEKQAMSMWGGG